MESESKSRITQINAGTLVGPIWFIGWLFTIAFAQLIWWQAMRFQQTIQPTGRCPP